MSQDNTLIKRITIYIIGVFTLGLGITFFIMSNTGVPSVASLPYTITLTTGISITFSAVLAHFLFLLVQIVLTKKLQFKFYIVQLSIALLFGIFVDFTSWLLFFLPDADNFYLKGIYLAIGIILCAIAVSLYVTADLPMMPYDSLVWVIVQKFQFPYGKTRIACDTTVVLASLTICLIVLQAFGAIGIGTFIAAYSIGKIIGILMPKLQLIIQNWIYSSEKVDNNLEKEL